MPLETGYTLADKYHIESLIGQGSYGRVYRARNAQLDKIVAIKELRQGEGEVGSTIFADYAERFRREARVQARFNHPNIVHVYDLLEPAPNTLYLVMEYVDGGSLRQYLDQHRRLRTGEALRLMSEILTGLEAVHNDPRAIVHRDLKPSNVLLTSQGHAKLTDFGLAQVGDESMRSLGGKPHPGTPAYMSPEQETTAAYLYPASDLFSAGCILIEMLTGVGYKQARHQKKNLRNLYPTAPPWLEDAIMQVLNPDPGQRPGSAMELREQLRRGWRQQRNQVGREKAEIETRRQAEEAEARKKAAAEASAKEKVHQEAEEKRRIETTAAEVRHKAAEEAEAQEKARRAAEEQRRKELILELAPGVGMEFVRIPTGRFLMGSEKNRDPLAKRDEFPQHQVHLDNYLIGKYPVTVAEFAVFVNITNYQTIAEQSQSKMTWRFQDGSSNSVQERQAHPVTCISFDDAVAFCHWISQLSGRKVRLPTEAEWEKAARGEDGRIYPWGNALPDRNRANFAWSKGGTSPVMRHSPQGDSPYGCADMAGNVWEWVQDWYAENYYRSLGDGFVNPQGPDTGSHRILRGGSWYHNHELLRCACRGLSNYENLYGYFVGFRCAISP